MYLFFIRREKTCDLPVTREKTVAETSFLCGFRDRGESSNPLTHAMAKSRKPEKSMVSGFFITIRNFLRFCIKNIVVDKKSAC